MRKVKVLGRLKRRLSANGPGITVAVIAMVVALTGVAFAGAGALTGKQKKEVKALIKKEAKQGPKGDPGPKGDTGAQGAAGPKGDTGAQGAAGTGTPGQPGASALVTPVAVGDQECAELGGALVEEEGSGSPVEVCNGEKGANGTPGLPGPPGPPGDPWTAGGTLPANGMLTGMWTVSGSGSVETPISFPIHLAGNLAPANVYFGNGEEAEIEVSPGVFEKTQFRQHCANGPLNPQVEPGFLRTLCIYYSAGTSTGSVTFEKVTRAGGGGTEGGGRAGAFIVVNITSPGSIYGSYAISGG